MDKADMGGSPANSSDFVRKLYKMLEDPSHESVVRWGNEGDSFVVLENEKFTKSILPRHFKHSNFASFVRQLNKYDFHKVRQNNEDSGHQNPYGQGAWEFKHPEFQQDKKDSLDNIRRKAPAPRKSAQAVDDVFPAQQIDLVNTQLVATQQQLQSLQERCQDLADGHVTLLQQVLQLQKIVKNRDAVMHQVMGFLHTVDAQRRASSVAGGPFTNSSAIGMGEIVDVTADDHPASPLQQATQLLGEFSAENLVSKDLERRAMDYNFLNDYTTPPQDQSGSSMAGPSSEASDPQVGYTHHQDLESMVYPVGQTNGIDPVNREHIHNIPYAPPPSITAEAQPGAAQTRPAMQQSKKSFMDPGWGPHKPRILLVEDDKTCARIGCKFLQNFDCGIETAVDGLEAVNKMAENPNGVDLILMDIIMPHLDGVSATVCIRENAPTIPIIAMTSNIRADDIDMYFRYGMNDVLPKPFTKEGMLRTLEKHLIQFKKEYVSPPSQQFTNPNVPLGLNMSHMHTPATLKEEPSPGKSGSPASSWHSPSQLGTSPNQPNNPSFMQQMQAAQGGQYIMPPTQGSLGGYQTQPQQVMAAPAATTGVHRRGISDLGVSGNEMPEKRQRMYPPPQSGFSR